MVCRSKSGRVSDEKAEPGARANDLACHASCLRTSHAKQGRGSSLTFGKMTTVDAKSNLRGFNSKFERMVSYSFFRHTKFSIRISAGDTDDAMTTVFDIPSDEQIDAVLLHLRFFVVTNEATSYFKIPQSYQALSLPAAISTEFDKAYDRWTKWRAAPSRIGGHSNSEFFAHMIYGERVHRNQKNHCDIYDEWMQTFLIKDFAVFGLCEAILEISDLVRGIYIVNRKVLALP
jgi:hypothetical protein